MSKHRIIICRSSCQISEKQFSSKNMFHTTEKYLGLPGFLERALLNLFPICKVCYTGNAVFKYIKPLLLFKPGIFLSKVKYFGILSHNTMLMLHIDLSFKLNNCFPKGIFNKIIFFSNALPHFGKIQLKMRANHFLVVLKL